MEERVVMGVSILVYMGIFFGMILIAWLFTEIVNAFRDRRALKEELEATKKKLRDIAYERNELEELAVQLGEIVKEMQASERRKQPANFFVHNCEIERLKRENKKLADFNKTYKAQLERKETQCL